MRPTRHRAPTTSVASLALAFVLAVSLVGCGGDSEDSKKSTDSTPSDTTASASPTPTVPPPPTIAGPVKPLEFRIKTADGAIDFDGTTKLCDAPDEQSLKVTATDSGTTAKIRVSGGKGTVAISGTTEFEGRVDTIELGDDGSVRASGKGSLADDAATPTSFSVLGNCNLSSSGSQDGSGTTSKPSPAGTFALTTKDGSVKVRGATTGKCVNPDESTLKVSFAGGGTTVRVDVRRGRGSVRTQGGTEFEGRVTSALLGDDGGVTITGKGSLADDAAQPTTFRITGSCA